MARTGVMYGTIKEPWAVTGQFNYVLHRDEQVGSPIIVLEIKDFT